MLPTPVAASAYSSSSSSSSSSSTVSTASIPAQLRASLIEFTFVQAILEHRTEDGNIHYVVVQRTTDRQFCCFYYYVLYICCICCDVFQLEYLTFVASRLMSSSLDVCLSALSNWKLSLFVSDSVQFIANRELCIALISKIPKFTIYIKSTRIASTLPIATNLLSLLSKIRECIVDNIPPHKLPWCDYESFLYQHIIGRERIYNRMLFLSKQCDKIAVELKVSVVGGRDNNFENNVLERGCDMSCNDIKRLLEQATKNNEKITDHIMRLTDWLHVYDKKIKMNQLEQNAKSNGIDIPTSLSAMSSSSSPSPFSLTNSSSSTLKSLSALTLSNPFLNSLSNSIVSSSSTSSSSSSSTL